MGVSRPSGFPFSLNSAVDTLLKQEFDIHRAEGTKHSLIETYGIDAQPVTHENLDQWRNNFVGVQYLHEPTNLLVYGAIDDLWQNSSGEYLVVDLLIIKLQPKLKKLPNWIKIGRKVIKGKWKFTSGC